MENVINIRWQDKIEKDILKLPIEQGDFEDCVSMKELYKIYKQRSENVYSGARFRQALIKIFELENEDIKGKKNRIIYGIRWCK